MKSLAEWLLRKPTGPAPRRRIKPMSAKRRVAAKSYSAQRARFLAAHPYCQVFIARSGLKEDALIQWQGCYRTAFGVLCRAPESCDVHHKAGRTGTNYLDETTWLAVSREAHDWIHAHPSDARSKGFLTP